MTSLLARHILGVRRPGAREARVGRSDLIRVSRAESCGIAAPADPRLAYAKPAPPLCSRRPREGGDMTVTIYHNPRCGKSRQALELLRKRGIEPTIVEYLKTPPSAAELRRLLKLLGMAPRQL